MTKKISKSIIAVILCVMMIIGNFAVIGSASDTEYISGNYSYTVSSGKATIVAYKETATGNVNIPETIGGYTIIKIDEYAFFGCTLIESVVVPSTVNTIGKYAFAYCTTLSSVTIPASVSSIGEKAFNNSKKVTVKCPRGSFAESYADSYDLPVEYIAGSNIYNLGEETYSFDNFSDYHSDGHCFGMSSTSSAYYLGLLNPSIVGISSCQKVNTLSRTSTVKAPICYYQEIQGSCSSYATVAGGTYYLYDYYNISTDWNSVINYVKGHEYDNSGALQIGYRKASEGGHAINFLRYSKVDGQDRIYAYDNNFPDTEVYFYRDSSGRVWEEPYETFSGSIDCIALRDVSKYFSVAGSFDTSHLIYSDDDTIVVEGAKMYHLDGGKESGEHVVFEVPKGTNSVKIIPLVDNASFEYLDKEYSFGDVKKETVGILNLAKSEDDSEEVSFNIKDGVFDSVVINDIAINYKSTVSLNAEIDADAGSGYKVTYTTSDPAVATVDSDGNVYGAGRGTATITCTVTDRTGKTVSDNCSVTVSYAWWQWIIKIVLLGFLWY